MTQQGISVGTQPVAVADLSVRTVDLARRVANSDCAVLISGEHGVGKEWIARFIHAVSPRADQPLRVLKCIGCDESTLEQAFAGAVGGTLLIDEVTELSAAAQARLIRLFESSFDVGQHDVRIIATTHRRLAEEVRSGRLRADLYFRLNVFPLMVAGQELGLPSAPIGKTGRWFTGSFAVCKTLTVCPVQGFFHSLRSSPVAGSTPTSVMVPSCSSLTT